MRLCLAYSLRLQPDSLGLYFNKIQNKRRGSESIVNLPLLPECSSYLFFTKGIFFPFLRLCLLQMLGLWKFGLWDSMLLFCFYLLVLVVNNHRLRQIVNLYPFCQTSKYWNHNHLELKWLSLKTFSRKVVLPILNHLFFQIIWISFHSKPREVGPYQSF